MRIGFFSAKSYDIEYFDRVNKDYGFEIVYHESRLYKDTVTLAKGFATICVFVQDELNSDVLEYLAAHGTKTIALRCAGFNNIDIEAATRLKLNVTRVPRYSPNAVAEHSVALMLSLNRHIHDAHQRVTQGNFSLNGLLGFDLKNKTAGIVGTGNIGSIVARILHGFDMRILAYDLEQDKTCIELGVEYTSLEQLFSQSDIISLHCPLTPDTHYLINTETINMMKQGVMLINTSRGAVIDTNAVIAALKTGKIGYLGLDVYEQEGDLFFQDLSHQRIPDETFQRLQTFPNVLITGHQGFFTHEALLNISETTLMNIQACQQRHACENLVTPTYYI